jgi:lipoprotein-anchoring transpeptidase ErfK/SrfK
MKYKILIFLLLLVSTILGIAGFMYDNIKKNIDEGFYLLGETNITLEYGEKYEESGFVANIRNKSHVNDVKVFSNVNINKIGTYEVVYRLDFLKYSKTLKRQITIRDTIIPVIHIDCNTKQYITVNSKFNKCKVTASDNYDNDITDKIIVEDNLDTSKAGDYEIKYTVSDSSNNKTSSSIKVYVRKKSELTYVNVYISKQRLDYYENNKLVLTTPITSGRNNATKLGNYKIRNKARDTNLYGADYVSFVKYWMGYGGGFGLHDASWRSKFGTMDYKTNGSHGCINMPTKAAKKLYNMIEVGTPVHIKN